MKHTKQVIDEVYNDNVKIAGTGLLGFSVRKLAPSKENLKKFQEQFNGHPMCGCYSCIELAKTFVISTPSIKEEVITQSMKDLSLFK